MSDALSACQELASRAQAELDAGTYTNVCIDGEPVFFFEYDRGLIPGHIYSSLGLSEYRISKSCEFHFDEWTKEPEDEDGDIPQDSDAI
jgi:hypothetical protein